MADVVYFDSGINLPFCPPTVNGIYISGSGCCSEFYSAFIGGNQTYNLTYTLPTSSGTSGQVLTNDGNGNLSWTTVSGGGGGTGTLTGTGTTNYLSKWSSSTALTNSIVLETGSTIDISGALRVTASSGTATSVMGRDANGYVSSLLLGNGLSISGGTLSFTGSTGVSGNFVPYLGATGNTDLGGYGIAGSYFQLSTSTGGTLVPGMFSWNGTDGTADLMLKGGNVSLQIGQEQLARVINETGANLLKSEYKVVRVNGSTGTRLKVALALASGDATSVETLGVVTENITLNQEGFVTTSGLVHGINTTGSLQGETWSDGDMLFLSPYVAGGLTNIKPQAPNHLVVMGYVVTAANNGVIYVKVDNGYELDELHNVLISSAATNELLAYDGVTNVWRNRTASSLNLVSGSGTATQVAFWGGVTTLSGSSNLYWDNTNGSLGVRTSTPSARLHVVGSGTTTGTTFLVQNSGGTNTFAVLDNGNIGINTNNPQQTLHIEGTMRLTGSTGDSTTIMGRNASGDVSAISIGSGLSLSGNTLSSTGGGGSGTVTGSGTATQVAFWSGATGTTSTALTSSTGLTWDNVNGRLGVGTNSPSTSLHVNGSLSINNSTPSGSLDVRGDVNFRRSTADSTHFLQVNSTAAVIDFNPNNSNLITFRVRSQNNSNLFSIITSRNNIGIGTNAADSSSILDITSTTLGFLPPRMSTTQKTGIASPAQGLVVYDTTMQALSAYNGNNWATVGGGEQMFTITGSTATINFNAGNIADITLATSTTLTLTGGTFGTFIIKLTQDATGGRTVSWPSNVKWSGGIPPSLTTTGGKVDVISLIFDGTNYYGTYALNF